MRVGHNGITVMATLAPLREAHGPEVRQAGFRVRAGIEKEVPIHVELPARPVSGEDGTGVEIHDVGLEAEADMRLRPGALQLAIARKSEDVVPHDIGFAVMLVKTAVRGAIDQVALGHNPAAAFIEVNAPAAVSSSRDIMPEVVANGRAGLAAQRVYAPHVAENGAVPVCLHPDVVDVIELHRVVRSERRPVTPGPADGDAGVIEVMDEIVRDAVIRRLAQPNAHRAGKQMPAVVEPAAFNEIGAGLLGADVADLLFSQLKPAGTQIREFAAHNAVALATAGQFQPIVP